MPPLVSAIVPFYGVEDYLAACLDSILAQTLTDFECILVDDGSLDDSARIAETYAARDPRVRIITQANAGLGPARNTGTAAATGRYLTFLDSDDLLAPRAFEQQVTSLERSGSDFAGSNVWRWSLVRGVELSWAHQEPFARRLQGTTIHEVPLLMRDRMVWNKMWRRTFWDDGGYEFPAIHFEDYPVTLKAHLEARAVDTLPEPSYVWRERPVGQSISSQGKRLVNVRDRVTAATMALDSVDALGSTELRELVHSHLVDVDLREITNSLLEADEAGRPAIGALARDLATRIDPAMTALAAPVRQAAYRAARRGDSEELVALTATAAPQATTVDRLVRKGSAVGRRARALSQPRARSAEVIDARHDDLAFTYRVQIPLRNELARIAKVTASLGDSAIDVRAKVLEGRIVADLIIPTIDLLNSGSYLPLRIELIAGPIHFSGGVRAATAFTDGTARGGYWLQPTLRGGLLGFQRHRSAPTLQGDPSASPDAHDARVTLLASVSGGVLDVDRPWPQEPQTLTITDHQLTADLTVLVAGDPADQPVSQVASRGLEIDGTPVRWVGPPIEVTVGNRQVEFRRGDDGRAYLVHRPAMTGASS